MKTKVPIAVAAVVACGLVGTAQARPFQGICDSIGFCRATIQRINVNKGDISFTTTLPQSETNKLACSAGSSVVNFRLPPVEEGNENVQRMFEMAKLAARERLQIEMSVGGSSFDCQVDAIAIRFTHW